ncbi:extracellular solute-binding protein [uncultured Sphingomonas sp.]|uniref:extracellular solute-binding protein n=1 Tax=uncultured Sphingomonas sp. TaxID=158754 RepID=UPI0025EA948C|nr:extracellular solute-binding protein [uncultured Sphingomonas sp.]
MSYQGDYAPYLTTAFTQATGVPVEVQSIPWTAAHEKLLTAHAGGVLPDVVMLPNGWLSEFQMIGAIAAVPDPALTAGLFPGLVEDSRIGGRDYGVPWSVAPQVQYYRRDILADAGYETPPMTWDGWRTMAAAIKRRRPEDHVFLALLNYEGWLFTMLAQNDAYPLRDRDTRGNFRTPEAREAFAYYISLFRDGYAPMAASTEVQDPLAAFAAGQFAVWEAGPTWLLDLRRRRAEMPPELWAAARVAGPRGPGPTSAKDVSLCVSARSPRQADAWALVEHLTSDVSELRFADLIGSLPARTAAWDRLTFPAPVLQPFFAQAHDLARSPMIVGWERIQIEVQLIAERMARGLMTIDAGLAEADRRTDRILAKRRALVEAGRLA